MKRILLSTLLAAALSSTAMFAQQAAQTPDQSQTPPAPVQRGPNPQKQTNRMTKELGLTPDQASKVEPILADRDAKISALRANTSLTPQQQHQQMHAIQQSTQQSLSGVLTPAQMQQLRAMRKEHEGHGAPPASQTPPPSSN